MWGKYNMTEEKLNIILNEYIEWLSFKNDDSYKGFYMNLKMLYKICIIMANGLDIKQKDINVEDLTEINLFDKLDMIKNFFKEVNIDIDIDFGSFKKEDKPKEELEKLKYGLSIKKETYEYILYYSIFHNVYYWLSKLNYFINF